MTEKQRDMKYLHKYKTVDDFKGDYYGSYYHEPWVSIHPGDKIMTCDLWGDEYYDTLKYVGPVTAKCSGGEGESEETIDVPGYLWDLSPQGDTSRYLFEDENPSVGTKFMTTSQWGGEIWVDYSSFDDTSNHIYDIRSISVDENAVRYNKRKVDLEAFLDNGCSWSEGCRVEYMEAKPEFGIYQEVHYNGGSGEGEGGDCNSYYDYYASGTGINPNNLESFAMRFWLNGEPVELDMVKSIYDGQEYWPTNLVAPYDVYVRIEEFYADPGKFAVKVHYQEGA